jgi:hypothetical protein
MVGYLSGTFTFDVDVYYASQLVSASTFTPDVGKYYAHQLTSRKLI